VKILLKAKMGDEFQDLIVSPYKKGLARLTIGEFSFVCKIADLKSALTSIEEYLKANAERKSTHAYKVGDVVDLHPVRGDKGRILARAPDGRVILFSKDTQPEEGKPVKALIVVAKPTYYIARPVESKET